MASETQRTGPAAYTSQWPLERTIGDLGQQIKQPSNPYANLSRRAVQQCQINVLRSLIPGLVQDQFVLPRGAENLGDDYSLLRMSDETPKKINAAETDALMAYLRGQNAIGGDPITEVARWARLRLPNRQVARSRWRELARPADKLRTSRYVSVGANASFSSD